MKKLATLLLAAGMVLGSFAGVQAIDFKARGEFQQDFGLMDGVGLTRSTGRNEQQRTRYGSGNGTDNFIANQRIRLALDVVASEHLMGQVFFEMGAFDWGKGGTTGYKNHGAYGQRAVMVGVRYAFIDWFVPSTDLRLRMGIQNLQVPSYTFAYSPVANYEGPAVNASYKFNDNVSVTAFWARALNDNAGAEAAGGRWESNMAAGEMDNVDAFGLLVPLRFDGFKVTPYGMVVALGPRAYDNTTVAGLPANVRARTASLAFPRYWATHNSKAAAGNALRDTAYATAWWAGLTGEVTAADPFRIAWEGTYGSVTHPSMGFLDRQGWWINAMIEYKMDWGIPGIYGWYASGDDSNPRNGSERMPMLAQDTGDYPLSNFGFNGSAQNNGAIDGTAFQNDPTGTWGIGLRLRDMSFIQDLKHTLRIHLMGGTNDPAMAKYMLGKKSIDAPGRVESGRGDFNGYLGNRGTVYLTRQDNAVEVNLDSVYKLYDNLDMVFELGYIHVWLDQSKSVWGAAPAGRYANASDIRGISTTDAVKASVMFFYKF